MKYTVEFIDRVSNSAFIYYVRENKLFGCDFVIETDRDDELYDESRNYSIPFEDLRFNMRRTSFESKPDQKIEGKITLVEKRQRERGWNCIRIESENELEQAIETHCSNYYASVKERLRFERARRVN